MNHGHPWTLLSSLCRWPSKEASNIFKPCRLARAALITLLEASWRGQVLAMRAGGFPKRIGVCKVDETYFWCWICWARCKTRKTLVYSCEWREASSDPKWWGRDHASIGSKIDVVTMSLYHFNIFTTETRDLTTPWIGRNPTQRCASFICVSHLSDGIHCPVGTASFCPVMLLELHKHQLWNPLNWFLSTKQSCRIPFATEDYLHNITTYVS